MCTSDGCAAKSMVPTKRHFYSAFAGWASFSVNRTSFLRGGAYRLSLVYTAACVMSGVLLIATIYWQTKVFEKKRIGAFVTMEADAISRGSDDQILWSVRSR